MRNSVFVPCAVSIPMYLVRVRARARLRLRARLRVRVRARARARARVGFRVRASDRVGVLWPYFLRLSSYNVGTY